MTAARAARGWAWLSSIGLLALAAGIFWGVRGVAVVAIAAVVVTAGRGLVGAWLIRRRERAALEAAADRHREAEVRAELERRILPTPACIKRPSEWHRARRSVRG